MADGRTPTPPESRFALFAGEFYYPGGGWGDYVDTFATVEDAKASVRPTHDWAHVVDLSTYELVTAFSSRTKDWHP